ncbi:hypothetical protein ACIPJS_39515, partial [Streptomyces sp. NPDC086783]|uniref:hypothetical protein n=1 Tax=Streptomyces sp. NPDC086783 TaxID=3365758 RepID=UPI0037FA68C7
LTTPDPITTNHPYTYVNSNPTNNTDPTGYNDIPNIEDLTTPSTQDEQQINSLILNSMPPALPTTTHEGPELAQGTCPPAIPGCAGDNPTPHKTTISDTQTHTIATPPTALLSDSVGSCGVGCNSTSVTDTVAKLVSGAAEKYSEIVINTATGILGHLFGSSELNADEAASANGTYTAARVLDQDYKAPSAATVLGEIMLGAAEVIAPELGADRVAGEAAVEEGTEFIYRGVRGGHPEANAASRGESIPWGGHGNVASHNMGNNRSIFTSWTTDLQTAENYARADEVAGRPGHVLRVRVQDVRNQLVRSPNYFSGEKEVLVRGILKGAHVATPGEFYGADYLEFISPGK